MRRASRRRVVLFSYPLAGAALTLAPPRSGKTATVALNLLRPGGAGFRESTIVVDPRGELWCVTAHRRKAMGWRVRLLDPFGVVARLKEEWLALNDLPAESVRWNPLDYVRDGAEGVGDLDVLLDALLTPPTSQSDAARHSFGAANADLNAARNIRASGTGATARREAFGLPTSMTREIDRWGLGTIVYKSQTIRGEETRGGRGRFAGHGVRTRGRGCQADGAGGRAGGRSPGE